jgi:serine/threonine protein kinase
MASSSHSNPVPGTSPAPGDFAAGEVIGGNYRVLSLIGRGGMGAVYRVHHLFLDKELALKTLSGDQITDVAWRRFQIEGQAIARLDHPNIIRIYDLGISGQNQPYYVMDVVNGVSLAQLIRDQRALKPEFALPIFRQVSAGLAYAHERGIIHRDLKPANIMLVPNSKAATVAESAALIPTAKILDFGLAKLTDLAGGGASGLTKTGEIFGSPLYMSPEQAQGLNTDLTTDIYSFGCSLYEALTGELPLKGGNALETMLMHQSKVPPRLAQMRPDLDFTPELERMVAKLLAKRPEDRYRSFADIASQLLLMERQTTGISSSSNHSSSGAPDQVARGQSEPDGQYSGEFTNPPAAPLTTKPWFWPSILAGSALFFVLLGSGAYLILTPKKEPPARVSNLALPHAKREAQVQSSHQDLKAKEEINQASAENTTADGKPFNAFDSYNKSSTETPFSSIEGTGVGQQIVFDFGTGPAIGMFKYDLTDDVLQKLGNAWQSNNDPSLKNPYKFGVPAQGKKKFLRSQPLIFIPFVETCNTPALFKRFRKDDLYQLTLANNDYVNSDFLPYIKHLTGLRTLNLNDTDVNDKGLEVIDSLTGLNGLRIDRTKISGQALAKSAVLQRLRYLMYKYGNDISVVIKAIENSPKIIELNLDYDHLTNADLKILARLPKLRKLDINGCDVGLEGLKILATSKSLQNLAIKDPTLTPKSIDVFASMNLAKLEVSGRDWTAAEKARLHVAMAMHTQHCELKIKAENF